ncbi:MAG: hypothetical protein KC561_13675, partial [Myxococcales bacterium]|nr:hypothetical protein [Myxococcales bacterium]
PRDPMSVNGVSGGSFDASQLGQTANGPCAGAVSQTPDHVIQLTTDMPMLVLGVVSQGDTTLVVQGPNGILACNDDYAGLNPVIGGSWPAGTYYVYVGAFGQQSNYTLFATEVPELLYSVYGQGQGSQAYAGNSGYGAGGPAPAPYGQEPYQGYNIDAAMGNSWSTGYCQVDSDCGVGTCVSGSCMTNYTGMMHDTTMSIIDNFPE